MSPARVLAAPRSDTSTSGISWLANSLALYTEAPASLTTTFCKAMASGNLAKR